ncbi:MAG: HK97 family phage prohead protease [Dehalococcoidales bacterium]|nr:HK97 family phage prohead protease [Dehalococcoidales bacterium]
MEINIEHRSFSLSEVRVAGEGRQIIGHAAVFNKLSEDLGGFKEKIAPGAFANTITNADVRALFNHDPNYVLGRTKSGTLSLIEDSKGLAITIDPPETQWANDLIASVKRGDISQMSFAFRAVRDEWDDDKKVRTLIEVELFDVSIVTYPAYPQTNVKIRSLIEKIGEDKAIEILTSSLTAVQKPGGAEDKPGTHEEALGDTPNRLDLKRRQLEIASI